MGVGQVPRDDNLTPINSFALAPSMAAYGSNAAALTSATDYSFKWGTDGKQAINHIMLQNNTSANLNFDLDATATAGSPVLVSGAIVFLDVLGTLVLHLLQTGTPNVNGTSSGNIVVRGWL